MKFLDPYTLRARYYPAILATIPALTALAILISWSRFGLTTIVASTAIPVLVFAAADIARRFGKRIQERIYAESGKPSIAMMRYADNEFDEAAKSQYRAFYSSKTSLPVPTEEAERADVKSGDAFYERGGGWLRENTRSVKKYPILFAENVTYGFRRNLLGLKWPALGLNLLMVLLCAFLLSKKGTIDTDDDMTLRLLVVVTLAAIHAVYMLFAVSKASVVEASQQYARQLILSCETFLGREQPARPVRAAPRKPKPKPDAV